MFSKLKKVKKKWFTMLEVVFVCTVFAMLVAGIILAINRTYIFMNNTKVEIRATNLTREGMEMMFNIRDTNRRKCSWKKDQFRLYLWSWASDYHEGICDPDSIVFEKWIYAIKEWVNVGWDRFIYAEDLGFDNDEDIEKFYSIDDDWFFSWAYESERENAKVVFTWTYKYWSWSMETGHEVTWEISNLLWDGIEFYRVARVYGIYCKNSDDQDDTTSCSLDSDPKEMRFCVKTFYKLGAWTHSTELCSIMTNFME